MNFPRGLILVGALVFGVGACASGGGARGGGGGGGVSQDDLERALAGDAAEGLETGESIRQNEMTRSARDELERAEDATPEEAASMYEAVIDVAEQAIQADPTNPLPWRQGGVAHLKLRNLQEADSMLDEAERLRPIYKVEIDPIRETEWIQIYEEGVPLVNGGMLDEAAELFEGANLIYDRRPEAMVVLGQVYARQRRAPEAIEVLQQALSVINSPRIEEVDSLTAATWEEQASDVIPFTMTDMFLADERYAEAAEMLRDLIVDDPDNLALSQNLGNVYVRLEMPDSARRVYGDLAARPGLTNSDLFSIGGGYYTLEDYEEAAALFERAVEQSRWDRDAAEFLTSTLVEAYPAPGSDEEETASPEVLQRILGAAEHWIELDPNSSTAYLIGAQTAQRMADNVKAGELITAADELEVVLRGLQFQTIPGGGDLTGQIVNMKLSPGTAVQIAVTFYGTAGSSLGTETVSVTVGEQEMTDVFQLPFDSSEEIAGYTYSVQY